MRSKTSVQPIIAGVRRQHLSELLRRWRRQPRKRSPLLFWSLFSLALLSDSVLLLLAVRYLNVREMSLPPTDRRIFVPYAEDSDLWEPLRHWVVRVDGRTRLFDSFCREAVRRVSGEECFEGRDPIAVVVSWMLDKEANSLQWNNYPFLRCNDAELRALLYPDASGPSRMAREEQLHGRHVEPIVARSFLSSQLSFFDPQAVELRDRLALFDQICGGSMDGGCGRDIQSAREELSECYRSGDKDLFAAALSDYLTASRQALWVEMTPAESRRLAWESWLLEYAPVRQALYWSLLAASFLATAQSVRPWRRCCLLVGRLVCLGSLVCTLTALHGQAVRDGTPPISNGSQGILWFSAMALGLGLILAALFREDILALTGAMISSIGLLAANHWPLAFTEPWPSLPGGATGDICVRLQVGILLSAYAVLTLSWASAALTLTRILLATASNERLCRMANRCVWAIGVGMTFLVVSGLLGSYRAMQSGLVWHGWNAQAVGALLVLPGCTALLYARRRGRMAPFRLLATVALGFAFLAVIWHVALRLNAEDLNLNSLVVVDAVIYLAGLIALSLTAHAALRYYFGRQRILGERAEEAAGSPVFIPAVP